MDITVKLTDEKYNCIQEQLNKREMFFQKRDDNGELIFLPDEPAFDKDGKPRLDDDGNEKIMRNRPDMEDEPRLMTVQDWVQSAIDGKHAACLKRHN